MTLRWHGSTLPVNRASSETTQVGTTHTWCRLLLSQKRYTRVRAIFAHLTDLDLDPMTFVTWTKCILFEDVPVYQKRTFYKSKISTQTITPLQLYSTDFTAAWIIQMVSSYRLLLSLITPKRQPVLYTYNNKITENTVKYSKTTGSNTELQKIHSCNEDNIQNHED